MKYLELVKGLFTTDHQVRAKQADPYVAYSVEANKLIFNLIHEETQINYFYIESLEDNNVITLDSTTWAGYGDNKSKLEYSNDTTSWTSMNGVDSITVNRGEKLYMRCIDGNICKDMNSISEEETQDIMLTPLFKTFTSCNIGGNINTVMFDYTYNTEECILPDNGFVGLFCNLDTTTLEPLNANYIVDASKLVLPAIALSISCYLYMFWGCTSLTAAPELPATTLHVNCYAYMFYNCTSLTTAPLLPASTLVEYCYCGMFVGCASLNYIKCLATSISAEDCTTSWVYGVASNGTFVKQPGISNWTTGTSGIPEGWTVIDAEL